MRAPLQRFLAPEGEVPHIVQADNDVLRFATWRRAADITQWYVLNTYSEYLIINDLDYIIGGDFQTPVRCAHLSSSIILCACSNIHLSDY